MTAPALATLIGALAVGAFNRRRIAKSVERDYARNHPSSPSGIVHGAEGFALAGTNGCGLLLLHGSGDSPQSLRYFGERLNATGYAVSAPLFPGHGRSPRDFANATASAYLDSARRALTELRGSTRWIGVIGLSMGGAVAAELANETSDLRVLVLLAPYFIPPGSVRWASRISWLWSPAVPYVRGRGDHSVHDAAARDASHAYGTFSAGALKALVATAAAGRRVLPRVTQPTLVINSELDNRIPRVSAMTALNEIGARAERHWVSGCGHIITVDYCKDVVVDIVQDFLARHAD